MKIDKALNLSEQISIKKSLPTPGKILLVIQTLIFSKSRFNSKETAISWALSHGFKVIKPIDETPNTYRLRQKDPNLFYPNSYATWALTRGVLAVGGKLKRK